MTFNVTYEIITEESAEDGIARPHRAVAGRAGVMAMRINSPSREHVAILSDDHPDGVRVSIWRQSPCYQRVDSWVIDCPWHVALDRVHAILARI